MFYRSVMGRRSHHCDPWMLLKPFQTAFCKGKVHQLRPLSCPPVLNHFYDIRRLCSVRKRAPFDNKALQIRAQKDIPRRLALKQLVFFECDRFMQLLEQE